MKPVTVLPNASWAVSVTPKAVPAVAVLGALTAKEASPAGSTVKLVLVPVVPLTLACRVRVSALSNVTAATPTPLTRLTQVGAPAWPSLGVREASPV